MPTTIEELRRILALRSPAPTKATLTYVRWKATDGIAAQIEVRVDPAPTPTVDEDYPEILFHREAIQGASLADDILSRLRQVMGKLSDHLVEARRSGTDARWPASAIVLNYTAHTRPDILRGPLVAFGQPPRMRAESAIRDWFGGAHPNPGTCRVIVEDSRGRIASVTQEGGRLAVVSCRESMLQRLELQAVFLSDDGHQVGADRRTPPENNACHFEPPRGTTHAALFLVNETNDVLDQRTELLPWVALSDAALKDRAAQAAADLSAGEREDIEFKPWCRPKNDKEHEIVKTIVAFGNEGRPCRLYVGVDDDGDPQGQSAMFKELPSLPPETSREAALRMWLKGLIDAKVRNQPYIDARLIEVGREPVFSVVVTPGPTGPCATMENDIYVRMGASSKRPGPERLRSMLDVDQSGIVARTMAAAK